MNQAVNIVFEFCLHIFGFSHFNYPNSRCGKLLSLGVFLFHVVILSVSIKYAFNKVSKKGFEEIMTSYVQTIILIVTILSSHLVFAVAWAGRNLERKLHENLEKVDKLLLSGFVKENKKSWFEEIIKFLSFCTFKLLPFSICILLSFVELLLQKKSGLWRILLYPILLIKFSMYHYAITVSMIKKRISIINRELHELVKEDEKINLSFTRFSTVVENQKLMMKVSNRTETFIKSYEIIFTTVKMVNKRFGVLILLLIVSNFLSIVFCGFNYLIEIETGRVKVVIIGE